MHINKNLVGVSLGLLALGAGVGLVVLGNVGPIHSLGMALVGPGFMLGAFGFGVTAMHACFYVRDLRLDRRLSQLQEVRLSQLQGVINAAFAQLLQQAAQQQDVVRLVQESYQLTESVGG